MLGIQGNHLKLYKFPHRYFAYKNSKGGQGTSKLHKNWRVPYFDIALSENKLKMTQKPTCKVEKLREIGRKMMVIGTGHGGVFADSGDLASLLPSLEQLSFVAIVIQQHMVHLALWHLELELLKLSMFLQLKH